MTNKYCKQCGCYVPIGEDNCVSCGASLYSSANKTIDKSYNSDNVYSLDAAMQVISPKDNTTPPGTVIEYKEVELYNTIDRRILSFETRSYPVQKLLIPKSPAPFCITSSARLNEAKGYIYTYTNDTNRMYIWANGQWVEIAS